MKLWMTTKRGIYTFFHFCFLQFHLLGHTNASAFWIIWVNAFELISHALENVHHIFSFKFCKFRNFLKIFQIISSWVSFCTTVHRPQARSLRSVKEREEKTRCFSLYRMNYENIGTKLFLHGFKWILGGLSALLNLSALYKRTIFVNFTNSFRNIVFRLNSIRINESLNKSRGYKLILELFARFTFLA